MKNKSNAIVTAIVCIKKNCEFDTETLARCSIRFYVAYVVNSLLIETRFERTILFN